jgi:hypothetical protein
MYAELQYKSRSYAASGILYCGLAKTSFDSNVMCLICRVPVQNGHDYLVESYDLPFLFPKVNLKFSMAVFFKRNRALTSRPITMELTFEVCSKAPGIFGKYPL